MQKLGRLHERKKGYGILDKYTEKLQCAETKYGIMIKAFFFFFSLISPTFENKKKKR